MIAVVPAVGTGYLNVIEAKIIAEFLQPIFECHPLRRPSRTRRPSAFESVIGGIATVAHSGGVFGGM